MTNAGPGTDKRSRGILDCPDWCDQDAWENDSILQKPKAPKQPPGCHCPKASSTWMGGCKPALLLKQDGTLHAFCRNCQKPLRRSQHKRRDQQHVISLGETFATNPVRIDLESIPDLVVKE